MNITKQGPTQTRLFPTAKELSENGHLILAIKTIIYATRVDLVMSKQRQVNRKYNTKLLHLIEKSIVLEAQACNALHDHSKD